MVTAARHAEPCRITPVRWISGIGGRRRAVLRLAALGCGFWLGVGSGHAQELKGHVRDGAGQPIVNADFNVYDAAGVKLPYSDNTDATGKYSLLLDPGRFDVLCQPPLTAGLAPRLVRGLAIFEDAELDWVLPPAVRVLGRVRDSAGVPVDSVDLDFDRADDGSRQPALGDRSTRFGTFAALIEAGTYHITCTPPEGSLLAPVRLRDRTVSATDTLAVTLPSARFFSGVVRGGLTPLAAARFVFESSDGLRAPVTGARSAANGMFRCGVAPGNYDVSVEPPAGTRWAALRVRSIDLTGDATHDFVLEQGQVLSGVVRDRNGQMLVGADWDAAEEPKGTSVPTPNDNTGADGAYALVLTPGRYRLTLTPPQGSGLDTLVFRDVVVSRDSTLDVDYRFVGGGGGPNPGDGARLAPAMNPTHRTASVTLSQASAVRDALIELFDASGRRVRVLHRGPLSSGTRVFEWDGLRESGDRAHTGVYLVRARLDGREVRTRFVLLP